MPQREAPVRIESPANRRIKVYRSLATAKGRREHKLFQLESISVISEALAAGICLHAAYFCPERARGDRDKELAEALAKQTQLFEVSERVLRHMSSTVTPQPVLAEASIPKISLESIQPADQCLIIAAVNIQDPGNMGAMLRTAHAVGADAFVAMGNCVDLYAPKVVRATMGSLFWVRAVHEPKPEKFLAWCKDCGLSLVAAAVGGRTSVFEFAFEPRTMLLMGSEAQGLPEELSGPEAQEVAIPMPGGTESLNVAVAAGIMMYEYRKQYPLQGQASEAAKATKEQSRRVSGP